MKSIAFWLSPLLFAALSATAEDLPKNTSSLIWYDEPATEWSAALPIGNGRLGAVIYGGTDLERIQLNEDTLWSAGPHDYDNPDAYSHLAGVRKLLDEKSYTEAEALAEKMMGVPKYQAAYQPLGELILRFPTGEKSFQLPPRTRSLDRDQHRELPGRASQVYPGNFRLLSGRFDRDAYQI